MFDRNERFKQAAETKGHDITFGTFTDYLREQYMQSKNLFKNTSKSTFKTKKNHSHNHSHSQSQQNIHHDNAHHETFPGPETNEEFRDQHLDKGTFCLTETNNEVKHYHDPILGVSKRKKKSKKLTVNTSQIFPTYTDTTPGPGAYDVRGSLIKPTFNRVYSEPQSALPSYLHDTQASGIKKLDESSLWNSQKGAFFNKKKYKHNKSHEDFAFTNRPRTKTTKIKLPQKPIEEKLYGVRYPPASDELIKRWTSISHGSYKYPNLKIKRTLVAPQPK